MKSPSSGAAENSTRGHFFPASSSPRSARWLTGFFSVSALAGFLILFIPVFIIRPFRYQSPRALWLAMALRQRAPVFTLIASLLCVLLAIRLWRGANWWRKSLFVLSLVLVCTSAIMSRLNHFEWMFHPIPSAQFNPASQAKLEDKEMIMAVRFGGDARAYPIRQMAYHHILNDTVDGRPIVVTY
jgi:F0F1-type ATP synthase assembly protein I